jgi:hypothetical protein
MSLSDLIRWARQRLGVRRSSAAFGIRGAVESGRGLPQSKISRNKLVSLRIIE